MSLYSTLVESRAPHNFDQPNEGVRDADLEVYEDCWPDGDQRC